MMQFGGALALPLLLAACGEAQGPAPESNQATEAGSPASRVATYSASGKVTAIASDQVTIAHGPVEGLGWPAMTMTFSVPSGLASGIEPGTGVDFSFRQEGGAYVLTSIRPR